MRTPASAPARRSAPFSRAGCTLGAAALLTAGVHGAAAAQGATDADLARQRARAARVEIVRDRWGVAHVYGRSDADAVFGMVYAQAEDDFPRVERNYLVALGRLAEAEGEAAVWSDVRARLFADDSTLRARYAGSPAWLRALMDAWADGLNYYLATHPAVRPRALARFEPWMALAFTEGSIGGDVEGVSLSALARFYGGPGDRAASAGGGSDGPGAPAPPAEPAGSNGFAIAPARTAAGRALLLINPHTSFYFRPEIHVVSDSGLNAYGAVTWGQFFVYHGFNDRAGWMHTSGGGDAVDEYVEAVDTAAGGGRTYRYGAERRPVEARRLTVRYRLPSGAMGERTVTAYFTHRGPVVRADSAGRWVSVRLLQDPVRALEQSYLRTKARSYDAFARVMALRTNTSNNTVYADADGTIAYWHGNFVPRRDPAFDYTRPVDGSDPRTDWRGAHEVAETVTLRNPASGWIQNTNNAPWRAAGAGAASGSPDSARYPAYMAELPENARGVHAVRVLSARRDFTLDRLIAAAYDPQLPAFEPLVPALARAYDALPAGNARRDTLGAPVAALRAWDLRWGATSVPTTLAVSWGEALVARERARGRTAGGGVADFARLAALPAGELLGALSDAAGRLGRDFGTWRVPWGEVNRFQRIANDPYGPERHDDAAPSLPVPFTSAVWGSLASFGERGARATRRRYGAYGNSFVAVVEFGPRVRAKSVLAGGVSGDPRSPHFADQAGLYARGAFKDVAFYRADVLRAAARRYRPGPGPGAPGPR